jgi:hypothetical protein
MVGAGRPGRPDKREPRMGHNSITVTADKYGHLYQGHTQDIESLDRLLKRA